MPPWVVTWDIRFIASHKEVEGAHANCGVHVLIGTLMAAKHV